MANYEITGGKIQSAKKVVIYGPAGIGKSTFAAQFPNPVFIDTEGSTVEMDVLRLPKPLNWTMMLEEVSHICENPHLCKTLVIDTADWAEKLAIRHVLASHRKYGIEDFGYGNGYRYVYEEFGRLLNSLQNVIDRGINVVLNAHAFLRKFEQPDEMGAYDRWALKLIDTPKCSVSAMVKEWADIVLFVNYKTYVVATDDKGKNHKAQGGRRVMYTQHHPCWDAKNRQGLEPELPFEFSRIAHIFNDTPTVPLNTSTAPQNTSTVPLNTSTAAETEQEHTAVDMVTGEILHPTSVPQRDQTKPEPCHIALKELMDSEGITPEQVRRAVAYKGYYPYETIICQYDPAFVEGCLIAGWEQVKSSIRKEN